MIKRSLSIALIAVLAGCIDPYAPKVVTTNPDFLIVDAFVDPLESSGIVTLTRSKALTDPEDTPYPAESGALVTLLNSAGNTLQTFTETQAGVYKSTGAPLNLNDTYTLHIQTANGSVYESEATTPRISPPIDSVTWYGDATGVTVQVTTHDDTDATRYYFWTFDETWEYTSAFKSIVEWQNGTVVPRNEDIYTCWRTLPSTAILIGNSTSLEDDIIAKQTIHTIPKGEQKLGIQYSMLVKQRAIDEKTYEFWDLMKKTTEEIGGFFDPQPFVVKGNIRAIAGSKPAIGLFYISSVHEQRLTFTYEDLPLVTKQRPQFDGCELSIILNAEVPGYRGSDLMVTLYNVGDFTLGYFKAPPACVDCRLQKGVNTKPDFW